MSRITTTTTTCDDCKQPIEPTDAHVAYSVHGPCPDPKRPVRIERGDLCRVCGVKRGFAALLVEVGDAAAASLASKSYHKDESVCLDPRCLRPHFQALPSPA